MKGKSRLRETCTQRVQLGGGVFEIGGKSLLAVAPAIESFVAHKQSSSLGRVRGGDVPSIVGDEWKTAYSAGFNSTTCACQASENLSKVRAEGKMGIMRIMGRMGMVLWPESPKEFANEE